VAFAMDPSDVIDDPAPVLVAILVLVGTATIAVAIQGAEVQHRQESVIDPLTGLLNRKALESRFPEIEQQAHLSGGSVCVIEFDLDHFKRVNDERGHEAGDRALAAVGAVIRQHARAGDLAARWGGEEFVVVLPREGAAGGHALAERVRAALAATGLGVTVSAGVGAAEAPFDPRALLASADAAMYAAKRAGRDRTVVAPALVGA
jgi:two-component system cell cycle response regulator